MLTVAALMGWGCRGSARCCAGGAPCGNAAVSLPNPICRRRNTPVTWLNRLGLGGSIEGAGVGGMVAGRVAASTNRGDAVRGTGRGP